MPIISIYNNKGGEGKSTVTVGLAEFLAANLDKRVLVIDMDAQASSACALLGHKSVNAAIAGHQTSVNLMNHLRQKKRKIQNLEQFLVWRPATDARGSALGEIAVIVPDKSRQYDVEAQISRGKGLTLFRSYLKPALDSFDYVLLDMPANVTPFCGFAMNGLVMSDFVVIPVQPTQMSMNALPDTFQMIEHVRDISGDGRPATLGFLLNSTDRRYQQYRAHFRPLLKEIDHGHLPPVFSVVWPPSSAFQTATDANCDAHTLKERFGSSYDHVRKVVREIDKRCCDYEFDEPLAPVQRSIWELLGLA